MGGPLDEGGGPCVDIEEPLAEVVGPSGDVGMPVACCAIVVRINYGKTTRGRVCGRKEEEEGRA